jgi:hypothetical protein
MQRLVFVLTLALSFGGIAVAAAKDDLKSGPQAGEKVPGPFHALIAHSEDPRLVGTKMDFFEAFGGNPVVLIFAREMTKPVSRLVKDLDAEAARTARRKSERRVRAVAVLLSADEALEKKLKEYGKTQGIKHVNLTIMEPGHHTTVQTEKIYKLSKDAEVTVILYARRMVKANHAFKKGKLNEEGIERILADLPKIAPKD